MFCVKISAAGNQKYEKFSMFKAVIIEHFALIKLINARLKCINLIINLHK